MGGEGRDRSTLQSSTLSSSSSSRTDRTSLIYRPLVKGWPLLLLLQHTNTDTQLEYLMILLMRVETNVPSGYTKSDPKTLIKPYGVIGLISCLLNTLLCNGYYQSTLSLSFFSFLFPFFLLLSHRPLFPLLRCT